MGEPGRLADHHPDARPPLSARGELLDPPVVEHGPRGLAVLGEHLGHVAAPGQGRLQHPLARRGPPTSGASAGGLPVAPAPAVRVRGAGSTGGIVPVVPAARPRRRRQLGPGLTAGLCASVHAGRRPTPTRRVALGSGDVPVLGTPRLVALCEEASCRAVDGRLGPGRTSVASRIQFDHLAPVPVGAAVTAEATLERVEGRRLDLHRLGPAPLGRPSRAGGRGPADPGAGGPGDVHGQGRHRCAAGRLTGRVRRRRAPVRTRPARDRTRGDTGSPRRHAGAGAGAPSSSSASSGGPGRSAVADIQRTFHLTDGALGTLLAVAIGVGGDRRGGGRATGPSAGAPAPMLARLARRLGAVLLAAAALAGPWPLFAVLLLRRRGGRRLRGHGHERRRLAPPRRAARALSSGSTPCSTPAP